MSEPQLRLGVSCPPTTISEEFVFSMISLAGRSLRRQTLAGCCWVPQKPFLLQAVQAQLLQPLLTAQVLRFLPCSGGIPLILLQFIHVFIVLEGSKWDRVYCRCGLINAEWRKIATSTRYLHGILLAFFFSQQINFLIVLKLNTKPEFLLYEFQQVSVKLVKPYSEL